MTNDMWTLARPFVIFFAAALLYVLALRRLADFAQPLRLRMAERGRDILADPKVHPEVRSNVEFFLDTAFNGLVPLFISIVLPFLLLWFMLAKPFMKKQETRKATDTEDVKLSGYYFVSLIAANPIFGIIAAVEIAISFLLIAVTYDIEGAKSIFRRFLRSQSLLRHMPA